MANTLKKSKLNYLLVCLMEECAEVQKEASKAIRFDLRNKNKKTTPEQRLKLELNDFYAIWIILMNSGLNISFDYKLIKAKINKVKKRMKEDKV